MNDLEDAILDEKLEALEKAIAPLINAAGFDALVGAPDYIIARHMVFAMIGLGQTIADLEEHRGGQSAH